MGSDLFDAQHLGWCILPPGLPTRVVSVVPVEGY